MLRKSYYNLLNIFSRGLNFIVFWVIINKFGASSDTDWFFCIYGVVYFCIGVAFYSIECALVPIWPGLSRHDKNGLLQTSISLGFIALFFFQLAGFGITLYLPRAFGFINPFNLSSTILISILFFQQPILAYFSAFYSSLLQSSGKYFWPITHVSWRAVGVLAIILIPYCSGIFWLAIAFSAGETLRLLALYLAASGLYDKSCMFKRLQLFRYRHHFISMGWMALMVFSSILNTYVDFIMVGRFGNGSATLVEYCGRLRGLPLLAISGMFVVLLGDWAREQGKELSWEQIKKECCKITLLGILLSGAIILSRQYWIPIIFGPNKFDSGQLANLNILMIWYLIGAPFVIASNALSRGFLVWQKFKLITFFALASVLINIILNFVLIHIFGITGVAMSTTGLDIILLCIYIYFGKKSQLIANENHL